MEKIGKWQSVKPKHTIIRKIIPTVLVALHYEDGRIVYAGGRKIVARS